MSADSNQQTPEQREFWQWLLETVIRKNEEFVASLPPRALLEEFRKAEAKVMSMELFKKDSTVE